MADKDQMIRKLWFLSFVIISIGNLMYAYSQQMKNFSGTQEILTLSLSAFGIFIWLFVYYLCAYRRPGTRLLTFTLYIVPIALAMSGLLVASRVIPLAKSGLYPLQVILATWMYVLTWKLRKINKQLQKD